MMRPGLHNAIPSCNSGLASGGHWYLNDHATAGVRRSWSTNIELQAQGGVDRIAKTAINRRCAVWGCFLWVPGSVR